MKKYAVVIFADAKQNTEESLGRTLNALIFANDLKNRGDDVLVFFQGTGTRWIAVLEDSSHPGHALYQAVKENIKGASKACASVFQAEVTTVPLLSEFDIPGIGGATSLAKYVHEGYSLVSF
ncbi:MAG: DsrE family protein [Legionellales bacterium]|nr:DsrE family protein [Legionellales bacterium]